LTKKPIPVKTPAAAATPPHTFDVKTVASLAKVVGEYDLSEIEVELQGLKIRVARERPAATGVTHVMHAQAPAAPTPAAPAPAPIAAAPEAPAAAHPGAVRSPMVGTAYLAASPEAKPFIEVGSVVKAGDKLLLVEAMKTFNEIVAPRAGKVTQILVETGTPVEYDQPLLILE